MILPVIKYGSPVLRKRSFHIDGDENITGIADNMKLTLKKAGGIGLAGPQVGFLKSIFIIDTSPLKDDGTEVLEKVYINPEILDIDNKFVDFNEACLSIPGIHEDVSRPERIMVRYMDENLNIHEETIDGLTARIYQHEYDHLNGILFIDKISPLRRKMIGSRLKELAKSG